MKAIINWDVLLKNFKTNSTLNIIFPIVGTFTAILYIFMICFSDNMFLSSAGMALVLLLIFLNYFKLCMRVLNDVKLLANFFTVFLLIFLIINIFI